MFPFGALALMSSPIKIPPAVLVPTPCMNCIANGTVPAAADQEVPLKESAEVDEVPLGDVIPAADIAADMVPKPPALDLIRVGVPIPLQTPPVMVLELTIT